LRHALSQNSSHLVVILQPFHNLHRNKYPAIWRPNGPMELFAVEGVEAKIDFLWGIFGQVFLARWDQPLPDSCDPLLER
jgi:hypothetical protein